MVARPTRTKGGKCASIRNEETFLLAPQIDPLLLLHPLLLLFFFYLFLPIKPSSRSSISPHDSTLHRDPVSGQADALRASIDPNAWNDINSPSVILERANHAKSLERLSDAGHALARSHSTIEETAKDGCEAGKSKNSKTGLRICISMHAILNLGVLGTNLKTGGSRWGRAVYS